MKVLCASLLLALAACGPPARGSAERAPAAWLVDATEASGVRFRSPVERERGTSAAEILGSGAALFDADGDGDLDLYLASAATADEPGRGALYAQVAPLSFADVSAQSGIGDAGSATGAAAADSDADGDEDLFVASVGPDHLFRNRGPGVFDDASAAAGIVGAGWSSSAAFADLDADGDLDLFVVRYLDLDPARVCRDAAGRREYCGPTDFGALPDLFYENQGDGTFRDASVERGLAAAARRGLGIVCADLAADGRLEAFVANDNDPNQLWVLGADGRFEDQALERGLAYDVAGREKAGMGVACADLDGDGALDLLLSHLSGEGSTLYLQQAPGRFRDASAERGLLAPTLRSTGFGLVVLDLDHDGLPEVAQLGGRVTRGAPGPDVPELGTLAPYAEPACLLRAAPDGTYASATALAGTFASLPVVGRALAAGDLDGDGDQDLVTTAVGDVARVWRNDAPKRGDCLRVRARTRNGADALGARVSAWVGERRIVGLVPSGTSYLVSPEPVACLGLGAAAAVERIEVAWPDGTSERFPGSAAGATLTLVEGTGE